MKKFDVQDALLLAGIAAIVGGVAAWSRPAAAIVFGVLCFVGVLLIERGKRVRKGSDGSAQQ